MTKGVVLQPYATHHGALADVEAGRIVFSGQSYYTTRDYCQPKRFFFLSRNLSFWGVAKKKDRKKALNFGPAASLRAESSHPGLQQAG